MAGMTKGLLNFSLVRRFVSVAQGLPAVYNEETGALFTGRFSVSETDQLRWIKLAPGQVPVVCFDGNIGWLDARSKEDVNARRKAAGLKPV